MTRLRLGLWIAFAAAVGLFAPAAAQEFPTKPMQMIVPFPPGGPTDLFARIVAEGIAHKLGQPVIVDNRSGAGGSLGTTAAARAPADGYTLSFGTNGTHVINMLLYPNLPYNPMVDFTPVALVCVTPNVLLVRKDLPVHTVGDLIALAKKEAGKLTFGTGGSGASNHLAAALLMARANIRLTHVPYRGNAPALVDVLAGRVDMMFDAVSTALPHIRSGGVKAIAVTTKARSAALPDLPTIAESGLADYDASLWWGVYVPAKTPAPIVEKLHNAVQATLQSARTKKSFEELGVEAADVTQAEFKEIMEAELAKWRTIVQQENIKVE